MKMTTQEIIDYLLVNQDTRKRVILQNISDVIKVNELLSEDDINIIINDTLFYDALYDHNQPFEDVLDDYFMAHLDITENSNDILCWLHSIYS